MSRRLVERRARTRDRHQGGRIAQAARPGTRVRAPGARARGPARTRRARRRGGRGGGRCRRGPRGRGGSPAAGRRRAASSISGRPAAGPSRIATATARLSATTGDGCRRERGRRRGRRSRPSRSPRRSAPRRARRRSPPAARRGRSAPRSRARRSDQRAAPSCDLRRGPTASGPASSSSDELAVGRGARGAARLLQQHQREQAHRLAARAAARRTQPRRGGSLRPRGRARVSDVARRRRVAFVEDQVDDAQHASQPLGELGARPAPRTGMRASRIFALARTMRCASVAGGVRKARAISSVVRPADLAQRQRDLRVGRRAPGGST